MMKKLLLADDSITIQKVVGIIFATEDFELTTTEDGDSAFEKALELHPDVVIADISMPGKDGFELCQAIKSEPSLSGTSVLLLPGAFDHFDEAKAEEVCADGWLTKPFESQALLDKVAQLVESEPLHPAGFDRDRAAAGSAALEEEAEMGVALENGEPAVDETVLGLDAVDELPIAEASLDNSPDDIWDAVSFEEDDLQVDSDEEDRPFVATAFTDSDTGVEEESVFDDGGDQDEESVGSGDPDPIVEEPFVVDETAGVTDLVPDEDFGIEDIAEESDEEDLVSAPLEESPSDYIVADGDTGEEQAEPEVSKEVDFSAYSDDVSAVEEDSGVLELTEEEHEEDSVDPPADLAVDDLPLELSEDDVDTVSTVDLGEDDAFILDDVDEIGIDDPVGFDNGQELNSFSEDDIQEMDVRSAAAAPDDEVPDDEILDLSEDDVVEELTEEDIVEDVADSEVVEAEPVVDDAQEMPAASREEVVEDVEDDAFVFADDQEDAALETHGREELEELDSADTVSPDESFYFEDTESVGDLDPVAETAAVAGVAAAKIVADVDEEPVVSAVEEVEHRLQELSDDELRDVVGRVAGPIIEKMAGEMLEKIAWDVVPDLAEAMIKEEIRKIKQAVAK